MNSEIAKSRISEVMKVDTITTEQDDFMATHVPVQKLYLLNKYEESPEESIVYSEEQIYQDIVRNPQNQHQFVIVYGASGAGKSHLIRWLSTKLINENIENESVIFISRNDNSLKGTIRQLLSLPEIQNMPDHDIYYKKLADASTAVNENVLKRTIYAKFHILIQDSIDKDSKTITQDENLYDELSNVEKKRLVSYLKDDRVEDRSLEADGPIERIYSKLAGNSKFVDRDTIAEFRISDFAVDGNFLQKFTDSDRKALAFANKLAADEDGTFRQKVVRYLNSFVSTVIQQCANLEPGDFEQIFTNIRKELFRQGKNLTLLIEDITSFTGVDQSLLNALMIPNTGIYAKEKICRISSIIGTTTVYFRNNFNDNHKMRVTKFIYIPTNQFSGNGLYEFVGKYMNTVSLTHRDLKPWVENNYRDQDYPVATVVEGTGWDTVRCSNGKILNLYPFTKNAITNLVSKLQPSQTTPRYIISEILEPILQDAIYNKSRFPSKELHLSLVNPDPLLRKYIISICGENEELMDRMITLTGIWGNNDHTCVSKNGYKIIAGLNEKIYQSLNIPLLQIPETTYANDENKQGGNQDRNNLTYSNNYTSEEVKNLEQAENTFETSITNKNIRNVESTSESYLSVVAQKQISSASTVIEDWVRGTPINVGSSQGVNGVIRNSLIDLNDYLYNVIDWQCYGISNDELTKLKNSSYKLVGLENQTKGNGNSIYIMKANRSSQEVLDSFIRYSVAGKKSWNYKGSENDIYTISSWTYGNRNEIIKKVKQTTESGSTTYIEAAIALDMIRMILNSNYIGKTTLQEFSENTFFDENNLSCQLKSGKHCKEWNELLNDVIYKDNWTNKVRNVVDNGYNLIQGNITSSRVYFINYPEFNKALQHVKSTKLHEDSFKLPKDDPIRQRKDFYEQLQKVLNRLNKVMEAEKMNAKPYLDRFKSAFEVNAVAEVTPDMISEFADAIYQFHDTVIENNVNIRISEKNQYQINAIKHAPGKILAAYSAIESATNCQDPTTVLLLFASDPINDVVVIDSVITATKMEFENTRKDLQSKKSKIGFELGQINTYENEQKLLHDAVMTLSNYEEIQ